MFLQIFSTSSVLVGIVSFSFLGFTIGMYSLGKIAGKSAGMKEGRELQKRMVLTQAKKCGYNLSRFSKDILP